MVNRPQTFTVPLSAGNRNEQARSEEELEQRRQQFSETLQDVAGFDTVEQGGERFNVPRPNAGPVHVDTLRREAVSLNRQAQVLHVNKELESRAAEQASDLDPEVVRNFNLTQMVNRYGLFNTALPTGSSLAERNQEMYDFLLSQTPEELAVNNSLRFQDIAFLAAGVLPPLTIAVAVGSVAGVVAQAAVGELVDGDEEGFEEARAEAVAMGLVDDDFFGRIGASALAAEEASGAGQAAGIVADIAAGGPIAFGRNTGKLFTVGGRGVKSLSKARNGLRFTPDIAKTKKGATSEWYQQKAAAMVQPLTNSDTLMNSLFQEDNARKIALMLENSKLPWASGILRAAGGRAALANMPVEKRGIVYAMHLLEADQKTDIGMSFALALGRTTEDVFGEVDHLGRVTVKGKKFGVGDLLENLDAKAFDDMTDVQRDWTRRMRVLEDRIVEVAKAEDIDINELAVEDGLDFASRQWMGIMKENGEIEELVGVGRSTVRGASGKGKSPFQKSRFFKTQEEGFRAGFVAVPQEQVLRMKMRSLYRKIAEKRFQTGVLSEVAWRSNAADDSLKVIAATNDKIVKGLDKAESVVQEALRGARPAGASRAQVRRASLEPQQLERATRKLSEKQQKNVERQIEALGELADEFPALADDLDEALALQPDEVLRVVQQLSKELKDTTRISAKQFEDALLMVRRSNSGRRFNPTGTARTTVSDAEINRRIAPGAASAEQAEESRRVLDSDPLFPSREGRPLTGGIDEAGGATARGREPAASRRTPVYKDPEPYDYGKRTVTPGELKAVLKTINKDNKTTNRMLAEIYSNAWKLDNAERTDALRAILTRINGLKPIAKDSRNAAKTQVAESRKWNRAAHILKDEDGTTKAFEHLLPDDPSKVIAFDSLAERDSFVDAYEAALKMADSRPPEGLFEGGAKKISDASSVVRLFQLGGDASSMFIHLIMLLGNDPKTWGKAGKAYVQGFMDSNYRNKLLADNAELLNRNPQVLLSTSGNEFTEALARGGLIARSRFRAVQAAGRGLAPFQQGVEASLDVAGIQMLKSMEHIATNPQERAQLAAYINEIRGLSNSSTLGITSSQRMAENIAFLAPRYNRAIGALVFDALRGSASSLRHPASLRTAATGGASGDIAVRQELARNALIRGIGALSGIAIALSVAQQQARGEPFNVDEVLSHLNPADPAFFTWSVSGQNVGPGSKIRSLAVLLGRVASDPTSIGERGWSIDDLMRNPAFRFLRSNFGPAVSKPIDLISGRNFIGEPTRDNAFNFTTNVVGEGLMPLALQSALLEGGGIKERALRSGLDFVGMRSYPTPAFAKFQYEAERRIEPERTWFATDEGWQRAHNQWRAGGVAWEDQPPAMQAEARRVFSDLWGEAERERSQRGLLEEGLVEWDEFREREVDKLNEINAAYESGNVPISRIRTAWKEYGAALSAQWTSLAESSRFKKTFEELEALPDDGTPEELLFRQYLQIVHDPELDNEITGRFDFDLRDARLNQFWNKIGHDARQVVEEMNNDRLRELPQAFRNYTMIHREQMRSYFDLGANMFKQQPHLWALIRVYRNSTRTVQQRLRQNPMLDQALNRIDEQELRMRMSNPTLDRLLVAYYPETYTPIRLRQAR